MIRPIYSHFLILIVSILILALVALDYARGTPPNVHYFTACAALTLYSFSNLLNECAKERSRSM